MYITEITEQRTHFMDLFLIADPSEKMVDKPIFENGIQCRDMIFLEMDL